MNEDDDTLNFGSMVESFGAVGLYDASKTASTSKNSCGIFFVLQKGETNVIKLNKELLTEFIESIKKYMKDSPGVKQMYDEYTNLCYNNRQNIHTIPEHPISICIAKKPTEVPKEVHTSDRYVTFIHNNAYPDVFKIDVSFVNGDETERFTFPASIIPMFLDSLENVASVIKNN